MAAELQRMEHQGAAPTTGLQTGIGAGDLSFVLVSGTGYPTGAGGKLFVIAIDPGTPSEEKILCSARSGNNVTVNNTGLGGRGFDNTSAASHNSGTANIEHVAAAIEIDDSNRHLYVTTDDDHTQYLRVDGTRAGTGAQTIGGALTVSSGGIVVTGNSTVTGTLTATSTNQATKQIATLTGTNGSYVGQTNGAPGSGTFATGDFADDPTNLLIWICTSGGTPGTWTAIGGSGGTDIAWTAVLGGVGFTNSWSNQGAPYYSAGFRKTDGKVYLRGVVKSGTVGSAMFTLPAGYRPASSVTYGSVSPNTSAVGLITIANTGAVTYTVGAGPLQVSLDGLVFDTLS